MRGRTKITSLLLLVAPVPVAAVGESPALAAAPGEQPTVAYMGSDAAGVDAETARTLDAAVEGGVRNAPVDFVALAAGAVERSAGGQVCASPGCLERLRGASGADHFVRASVRSDAGAGGGEAAAAAFVIEMQAIRAVPFEVVASGVFTCARCTPDLLAMRSGTEARALVARLLDALGTASMAAALHPASGGTVAAARGADARDAGAGPAPPSRRPVWLLGGAAAIALLGGATLLALDGASTCDGIPADGCGRTWELTAPGVALVAAGALSAAGALLLAWRLGERAELRAGPGRLTLGGTF